jgi:hypothetical protein
MTWQPYHEPLRTTLLRNLTIALIVGAVLSARWGGLSRWPIATLLALWPTLGGHYVELFFLNVLRPRLPAARPVQVAGRLAVWFVGGTLLFLGMALTAALIGFRPARPSEWVTRWWLPGLAFIAIELFVHLLLHLRRRPNFYNARA